MVLTVNMRYCLHMYHVTLSSSFGSPLDDEIGDQSESLLYRIIMNITNK
jgi:hypothetical protein